MDSIRLNRGNASVLTGVPGKYRSGRGNPSLRMSSRGISEGRGGSKTFLSGQSSDGQYSNKSIAGSKNSWNVKKPSGDARQGCLSPAESFKNAANGWFDAAQNNDFGELAGLLKAGFDINQADDKGQTALHYAVSSGNRDAVNWLLKNKAEINRYNKKGMTASHLAAYNGNNTILTLLLESGADINLGTKGLSNSLLHLAVQMPCQTSINDAQQDSVSCIETLIQHRANIRRRNASQQTVLHVAVRANNFKAAEKLLQVNTDIVNELSRDGLAALHIAASLKNCDILVLLINHKADINALDATKQKNSALHFAAESNAVDCINILVAKGANLFCRNQNDQEPAGVAAKYENTAALDCLLEHKKKWQENTAQSAPLPATSVSYLPDVDCIEHNRFEEPPEMTRVANKTDFHPPDAQDLPHWNEPDDTQDKLKRDRDKVIQSGLEHLRLSVGRLSWLKEMKDKSTKNENK